MVDREIYELKGDVAGLKAALDTWMQTWEKQDQQANAGRHRVFEKVEELKVAVAQLASRIEFDQLEAKVNDLSGRVGNLETQVTELKPHADQWNDHQQQLIGSKRVIAVVWSAILVFTGMFGGIVVKLLDLFWPPKGH
jgi:hypothetical protein